MEHYYGNVLAPTIKQDWIIDLFAVTNLPELPLCVAEEFTEMTAEPASQISFNSFKEKYQQILSFGFQCIQVIRLCRYK